jgi:hypothetical protein
VNFSSKKGGKKESAGQLMEANVCLVGSNPMKRDPVAESNIDERATVVYAISCSFL